MVLGLSGASAVIYHLRNLEQHGTLPGDGLGWRTCPR